MTNNQINYLDTEETAEKKRKVKEDSLKSEYDSVFDGEDKLEHDLFKIKSKINIYTDTILIDDIITTNFKKISRSDTIIGLTGVVGEWGVVTPIHVLKLEDEDTYMLLDGFRRVFAGLRTGKTEITAIVWDFVDKEEGKEMANVLSLMLNRSQRFSSREMWEQMKMLEEVNGATPGLIEYLLQMHSGDAMKLKDVMLSDMEYDEIKNDLLDGKLNIDGAYRKLCNARKKENRLAKEDSIVIEDTTTGGVTGEEQQLSVDAVKELLEMSDADVENESLEDLDRSSEAINEHEVQEVGNRHPIDPFIKRDTMVRDGFKCQCCGTGGHSGWSGVMVYHHIIPVFLGGEDSVENGATLCSNCHITIHLYSFGKLTVDLKTLDDKEKRIFKNIFKYGNIIIEGMKRAKISKDVAYKADAGSRRHLFPGEGLEDNKKVLKELKASDN